MNSAFDKFSTSGRIADFDRRNGGSAAQLGAWFWYRNGAARELDPNGSLIEIPADEHARLSNIVQYHRARLVKATHLFDNLKTALSMSADTNLEGLHQLKLLQAEVAARKEDLDEAMKQLANTPQALRRSQGKREAEERRQKQVAFQHELRAIRV